MSLYSMIINLTIVECKLLSDNIRSVITLHNKSNHSGM